MNVNQKNRLEMLFAVKEFYAESKDALAAIPAAAAAFSDIEKIQLEISLNDRIITEGTKGKVVSKDTSQEELIKVALVFAGALYGYAADKGDAELMVLADINSKTFLKKRDSEIPGFVKEFIDKADLLGQELVHYGITGEKRMEARAKLEDYIKKFGTVSTGKTTKKAASETIKMLFRKADQRLKVLDKLMLNIKEDNPELYSKYTAARLIVDKAATRDVDSNEEPGNVIPPGA